MADVYRNWQQNRTSNAVSQGMITLLKKDASSGNVVGKFRLITLLNTDFKILVNVLVKRLELIVGSLVGEARMHAMLNRSIHDNPHLMQYIIE